VTRPIMIKRKTNNSLSLKNMIVRKERWIRSFINTKIGLIPVIANTLTHYDTYGTINARIGINRHNYSIIPGLYASGKPDANSPVLVTANYKLTFDKVRSSLQGISAWILLLDTKGVNVWCAAGKGTFGTKELIKQIEVTKIGELINHKSLILPQLGAPGVSGYEVTKKTGLSIHYGPVYAKDIPAYINRSMVKTDEEKIIHFTTIDRLVLTPIEIKSALVSSIIAGIIFFIAHSIASQSFTLKFLNDYFSFLGAIITGGFIFPLILPILPFRSFALKGALLGLFYSVILAFFNKSSLGNILFGFCIYIPVISFMALNFTGATTFTSISGVKKEIKIATPLYLLSVITGIIIKIIILIRSAL